MYSGSIKVGMRFLYLDNRQFQVVGKDGDQYIVSDVCFDTYSNGEQITENGQPKYHLENKYRLSEYEVRHSKGV